MVLEEREDEVFRERELGGLIVSKIQPEDLEGWEWESEERTKMMESEGRELIEVEGSNVNASFGDESEEGFERLAGLCLEVQIGDEERTSSLGG